MLVLEAHDQPGGYAHSFRMRDFRFCAQVHYVFSCGEGETIHRLLGDWGARALAVLAETFPKDLTPELTRIYQVALKDAAQQLFKAADVALKHMEAAAAATKTKAKPTK